MTDLVLIVGAILQAIILWFAYEAGKAIQLDEWGKFLAKREQKLIDKLLEKSK